MENRTAAQGGGTAWGASNLDPAEVERFARLAEDWWNPRGTFRPLHQLGPVRMQFVREEIERHFGVRHRRLRPLEGLAVLDVGCGGGLVSEPLARLGGTVTAIDPAPENVAAARLHARQMDLDIDYRATTAEALAETAARFDVVVCLEVLEHVPDPVAFVATIAGLARPGGLVVLSTLNRTLKAYALAIVGAEHILRWLPVGTHSWDRFITPSELEGFCTVVGLKEFRSRGMVYNPLADRWSLSGDRDVNYLAAAAKPAGEAS